MWHTFFPFQSPGMKPTDILQSLQALGSQILLGSQTLILNVGDVQVANCCNIVCRPPVNIPFQTEVELEFSNKNSTRYQISTWEQADVSVKRCCEEFKKKVAQIQQTLELRGNGIPPVLGTSFLTPRVKQVLSIDDYLILVVVNAAC